MPLQNQGKRTICMIMYKDVEKVHPVPAKSAFPHTLLRRQVFSAVSVQTPLFQEGFLIFCTSKNTTLKWTIRGQYVRIIYIWDTRRYPPMRTWERLTGAKQFKEEKTKWLEK